MRGGVAAVGVIAPLYLLVPGHPLSWLDGVPLRPLALAVLLGGGTLLVALAPAGGRLRFGRSLVGLLVILTVLKVALGMAAPSYGLPGWYYANTRFQGSPERSTEFRGESWTRREREVTYGGDEFPVYFLNDYLRFNFYGEESERRKSLPFSVRWDGTLYVPSDGSYRLWLTASGPGRLSVDGKQIALVDADGRDTKEVVLSLRRGSHVLQATYVRRAPRSPDFKLEWDLGGSRHPLATPYLLASAIEPFTWERDQTLGMTARAVDSLALALLAGLALALVGARARLAMRARAGRWPLLEGPLLGVFVLVTLVQAMAPRLDRVDKMVLLGGGQDWLTHETLARDILLDGPLMTLGTPLGAGRPYYAQPFYPYALAGFHWLAGEDLFGVLTLQVFGLALAGVLLYFLAKRLFGVPAALATFALFLGLREWHLTWVSERLLSESIYVVILPAMLLCLLRYLDERRPRDAVLAGLLLGLAIVTRAPTLLYLPLAALLLVRGPGSQGLRPARARLTAIGMVAGIVTLALSIAALVPLRNAIVTGQPTLVAASGGANLLKHHRPTSSVRTGFAAERWYAPFVTDIPTREVIEFALQDPLGYAASYVPLTAYVLGYGAAIDESQVTVWPDLIGLNILYVLMLVLSRRARTVRAGLLHAFIAIHFLTMVVFTPYDYDNRLVLPMYLPIAVFAGAALAGATGWVWTRVSQASSSHPADARSAESSGA
ncbi:MAG: glycosyltransferase family 39 protein [Chloroflexi bacterium]|nr:glycosyltransferase family 39 protein [Chloroflexota bacterium]